ncbi:Crp/Fnr family transcriptional regulator [Pontivivens insulae]|uniref:Crp/Fnr family transcriptional regulator n=1 Tax=Pontivivens insulae TaxID=1639689 RepID=UPI0013C319B6|nr:Crp/Fnr family transcriptional regulator [Pontivivens insulae]
MNRRIPQIAQLRAFKLFADVPTDRLERFAASCETLTVPRGSMVLEHEDEGEDMFLVHSGRMNAILLSGKGREVALGEISTNQYFGELNALDGGTRSASIYARTEARLTRVPGAAFRELLADQPDMSLKLLKDLAARVRDLTQRSFELTALKLADRLCLFLLRMAVEADVMRDGGVVMGVPTHAEIGARVGANREAVSREMSALSSAGLIETHRQRVVIRDADGLMTIADRIKAT